MRFKAALMDSGQLRRTVIRMAHEMIEDNRGADRLMLVGIEKRGLPIAKEIAAVIETVERVKVPVVGIDVSSSKEILTDNRADKSAFGGVTVVIVNDVIYTGRTMRAAIETVMRESNPDRIRLAAIVDRGGRELPLSADYTGMKITALKSEVVSVSVKEVDGENRVDLFDTED